MYFIYPFKFLVVNTVFYEFRTRSVVVQQSAGRYVGS